MRLLWCCLSISPISWRDAETC